MKILVLFFFLIQVTSLRANENYNSAISYKLKRQDQRLSIAYMNIQNIIHQQSRSEFKDPIIKKYLDLFEKLPLTKKQKTTVNDLRLLLKKQEYGQLSKSIDKYISLYLKNGEQT